MPPYRKHIFDRFGGEDLLTNPLLLDPSKTDGITKAVDAANIDLYRTGMLSKRLGKEQQGPDITGTAFSQTAGGTDLTVSALTSLTNTIRFFQKFTPSANFEIFRIAARMRWVSATKPNFILSRIYTDSAGLPGTVLVTSDTLAEFNIAVPSTGFAKASFVYPSPYTVLAGTTYWFSVEYTKSSAGTQTITMDSTDLGNLDVVTKTDVFGSMLSRDLWYEVNTGFVQGIYDYRFSRDCDTPNSLVLVAIDGGLYYADPSGSYTPKKYGGISPDPYPPLGGGTFAEDYLTAITAERIYTFITEADGTMSNGDVGYVISP